MGRARLRPVLYAYIEDVGSETFFTRKAPEREREDHDGKLDFHPSLTII